MGPYGYLGMILGVLLFKGLMVYGPWRRSSCREEDKISVESGEVVRVRPQGGMWMCQAPRYVGQLYCSGPPSFLDDQDVEIELPIEACPSDASSAELEAAREVIARACTPIMIGGVSDYFDLEELEE